MKSREARRALERSCMVQCGRTESRLGSELRVSELDRFCEEEATNEQPFGFRVYEP